MTVDLEQSIIVVSDATQLPHTVVVQDVAIGAKGDKGDKGDTGDAATATAGTTTTLAAGSSATVTNVGTLYAAIFDFGIPKGDQGIQGIQGVKGDTGAGVPAGGTVGQIIVKTASGDYLTAWASYSIPNVPINVLDNGKVWQAGAGTANWAYLASGANGSIQFANASVFASDATKLFWNNTSKRLGVGTNDPQSRLHIVAAVDEGCLVAQTMGAKVTIQEWRIASGATVASVSATGVFTATNISGTTSGANTGDTPSVGDSGTIQIAGPIAGTFAAATSLLWDQTNKSLRFSPETSEYVVTYNEVTSAFEIGEIDYPSIRVLFTTRRVVLGTTTSTYAAGVYIKQATENVVQLAVQGKTSGQTANLTNWMNGSGTVVASISATGSFSALNFSGTSSGANTGDQTLNGLLPTQTGNSGKYLKTDGTDASWDSVPLTPPSGVAGAVQFTDGSAFASDETKFFWDNTNKYLGIGTGAPVAPLHVLVNSGATQVSQEFASNAIAYRTYSNTASTRSQFRGMRYRGTYALPTIIVSGDRTFSFQAYGYDGANAQNTAAINFYADGTVAVDTVPQRIVFSTGTTTSASDRLVIKADGKVGITQMTPTGTLHVQALSASTVGAVVQGAAAQTANLTEWHNSSATVLASVSATGDVACARLSSRGTGESTLRTSLNTFTATANRNNVGITAGHSFIPAAVLTVSQLGRYYAVGNTQDHQIGIWERDTGTLITSGTILAATASDGNGMKYVAVTPVNLDPSKEYVIAALESDGGDLWPDSHSTSGFFNNYVKRVGPAYFVGATFTLPNTFSAGLTVYNVLDFKFTANASIQIKAEYDANSYLGIMARSTFGSTLMLSNNDTSLCVAGALSVGLSAPPTGYLFSVSGNSRFSGNIPIETTNAGSAASGKFVVGATNVIGINGISVRSNYVIMDSGAGGDIIFNYDNTSRNVGISAIFSSIKFGVSNTVASNIVSVFRGAAAQTANLTEWQNSSATVLAKVEASGKITTSTNVVANTQHARVITIGSASGQPAYPGIWFGPDTPSLTNYAFLADIGSNQSLINAPSGGNIQFRIANSHIMTAYTAGVSIGTTTNSAALHIEQASQTVVKLLVKGAASQTANLQEWQNSSGTVLVGVTAAGAIYTKDATNPVTGRYLMYGEAAFSRKFGFYLKDGGNEITLRADSQMGMESAGSINLIGGGVTGNGVVIGQNVVADPKVTSNSGRMQFGNDLANHKLMFFAAVAAYSASTTALVVKGEASQTANLQEWQNSAGVVQASVCALGCAAFTGLRLGIRTVTSSPTLTQADYTVKHDCTSGAQTVTLPTGATQVGRILVFKKVDTSANAVTIGTVDGATLSISTTNVVVRVQYDGTVWSEI